MPGDTWRETTLGEVLELKRGYDLPSRDRRIGPYPIVSSSGITDFHAEAKVNGPGVVTGRYGTLGQVFYIEQDFWPLNTSLYVRDFKNNDPRFVSYFLQRLDFLAYSDKAAVPGLNRNHLHSANVRIPDRLEQRAIAAILGALDDKIELNRRMNGTLEAMARAIFKSWFIDFDPVRAKAEGRDPKLPKPIADLFPDSFQHSGPQLGEIPKGWRAGTVGEIITIHDSKRIPVSSRERATRKGPYRYLGAAGIVDYVDDFLFDGIYVLVGEDGSVVTEAGNPVVQYVWGKFWVNNHAHVLKGNHGICEEHLHILMQHVNVAPFVTGAVQPKVSQGNLKAIPILRASPDVDAAFGRIAQSLFAKIRLNHDANNTLAALRDALLPKLISGEIRIKDAERIVGRAV